MREMEKILRLRASSIKRKVHLAILKGMHYSVNSSPKLYRVQRHPSGSVSGKV